jgi:hypothetical protein
LKYVPNIVILTEAINGQTSHGPLYIVEALYVLLTQLSIRADHYQYIVDVMELNAHILFFTSKVDADDTVYFN